MKASTLARRLAAAVVVCAVGCCPMCSGKKGGAAAQAQAAGAQAQTLGAAKMQAACPVMGGKINTSLYTDYGGKRVYACCPGCLPEIRKDPARYVVKLEGQGVTLDRAGGK